MRLTASVREIDAVQQECSAVERSEGCCCTPSSEVMDQVDRYFSQSPWITTSVFAAWRRCEEVLQSLLRSLDRVVDVICLV